MKFENKKDSEQMDTLLKNALKPMEQPEEQVNTWLLTQIKEENYMRKRKIRAAVLAACCMLVLGSISTAAAVHYLTSPEVAKKQGNPGLAAAFQEKNQVSEYEKQAAGGWQVTFMGLVSGETLSDFPFTADGELVSSETYALAAIEKADGTPISERAVDWETDVRMAFFLEGENPYGKRIANGSQAFCENGVIYCMMQSDNIEIFAGGIVYLAVYEGTPAFGKEQEPAYLFDVDTGKISRNPSYEGLNALFTVPLDASKGDAEAVRQYLRAMEEKEEPNSGSGGGDGESRYQLVTAEELGTEEGQNMLRERSRLTASVPCQVEETEEGAPYVEFSYETEDGFHREGKRAIEDNWEKFPVGTWLFLGYSETDSENGLIGRAEILHKEADGSFTMNVFQVTD